MSERIISVVIPTYNRVEMLFQSFWKIINNDNVGEVVIVDDVSDIRIYNEILDRARSNDKIKVFRNEENQDCYRNKMISIAHATNDWCILLDSDNQIDFNYLFHVFQNIDWQEDTAYLPSFAMPHFDYRKYEGLTVTKENVHKYTDDPTFTTMLNTHNHFVNRKFYLKCWDSSFNPFNCDSIYMNYLWLKNGGKLYVVPGLQYQHRVDNHGSEEKGHYGNNANKTPSGLHDQIVNKLKSL